MCETLIEVAVTRLLVARQAALGGDDQTRRIGIEGFGDERLAHLRPVGIGDFNQVDASSCAWRMSRSASCLSGGGPQIHRPVRRIAPTPKL
jgi:hypothetical protein